MQGFSTVVATQAISEDAPFSDTRTHFDTKIAEGFTLIEAKSGVEMDLTGKVTMPLVQHTIAKAQPVEVCIGNPSDKMQSILDIKPEISMVSWLTDWRCHQKFTVFSDLPHHQPR